MVPKVAVMVAVPPETAVTMPLLIIVATALLEVLQTTCEVISWAVPSE